MRWFTALRGDKPNALFYNIKSSDYKCIVSKETNIHTREFTATSTHIEFAHAYEQADETKKVLYEVIMGERNQKIYFDVDVESGALTMSDARDMMLQLIQSINKEIDCGSSNIMVFNSFDETDLSHSKISYHVVIDRHYVKSNVHNKVICKRIISNLDDKYHKYVDILYSTLQQFRMLGSHKVGKDNRVKRIDKDLSSWEAMREERMLGIERFLASLITNTSNCKIIDVDIPEEKVYDNSASSNVVHFDDLNSLVHDKLGCYKLLDSDNYFYPLRRISKNAICLVCERCHDNENAFLTVDNSGCVYFQCFRGHSVNKMSKAIGYVKSKEGYSMFDIERTTDEDDMYVPSTDNASNMIVFAGEKPKILQENVVSKIALSKIIDNAALSVLTSVSNKSDYREVSRFQK